MNAYLCTYRSRKPSPRQLRLTEAAAKRDPLLQAFLASYNDSYYDWGDDPSFFAAQHLLGDVRKASWGVCRRDVRDSLGIGDVVFFFCARHVERAWHYHFVGFGTVRALVKRKALWTDAAYAPYRKFYNVLARLVGGRLVQSETFHDYHDNWSLRAKAPYVLFDVAQSSFNLRSPHHVGTWEKGASTPETWFTDARSTRIEHLLFVERGIRRRLRTAKSGFGHAKLNLLRAGRTTRPGRTLPELTQALNRLV
jgi:hypothetical protein